MERLTKRFYERFKTERERFLGSVEGAGEPAERAGYASFLLNRLMFLWFLQKKRFLDDDPDYLKNRLAGTVPKPVTSSPICVNELPTYWPVAFAKKSMPCATADSV